MSQKSQAASSPAATKTNHKPPVKQSGNTKPKLTKKQIGIICGVIVVLVAALVVIFVLVLNRSQPQTETTGDTGTTQDEPTVDYNQKITDKDGNEFKAEYQAGSEQSFVLRFSDLKCEDSCKNVGEVKLGDKTLKQGEDYEVQSGSIIIILTENFMKSLKAAKYDLIIAVLDDDKTTLYGVKFTVKPEPTCGDDEALEKGECVKKPEEQPAQDQTGNTIRPSNSNSSAATQPSQPSQPSTPSKSQAQIECESKAAPTGFSQVRWFSAADRQELGYEDDWAVGISVWDIDSSRVKMRWANGACYPAIMQAPEGSVTGVGLMPTTLEDLRTKPYPVYQAAYQHQGRNMVVWYWGDQSNYTIEFMDDVGDIWRR